MSNEKIMFSEHPYHTTLLYNVNCQYMDVSYKSMWHSPNLITSELLNEPSFVPTSMGS